MGEYQAAAAANDLPAARKALLKLVQAKDDVSDYWSELGKVQASMGSYGDAYYAFQRAYELDRRNPDLVRAVTQLALRSGDIAQATAHAEELEVLAPGDPWVQLTKGWAAVAEHRYDQALTFGDGLLATTPFDPSATVLKGRALIGLGREDDAIDLLQKQLAAQPSDSGSLQLLARIYVKREDWANVTMVTQRLNGLTPNDQANKMLLVQAALRAGKAPQALEVSSELLQPNSEPSLIASVLDLWAEYWASPERVRSAVTLANRSQNVAQKLVYASFLNRVGSPAEAIRLAANSATLPINANNAEANAVMADAWARTGNLKAAKDRFDAVIAFDPGNATALRGRAQLELQTHNVGAAVKDAQKLVTVLPSSARDRLLLAQCFEAAGNNQWRDRTLWTAFQDLPADEMVYSALLATRKGNSDATLDVQEEFARQRDAKLGRGLL